MIQKVARALSLEHHGYDIWDDQAQICRDQFLRQARAAIEAMRYPSPGMIKEAEECFFKWLPSARWTITMAKEAYIAAIDAALKEE